MKKRDVSVLLTCLSSLAKVHIKTYQIRKLTKKLNKVIRIAPSYPSLKELELATKVLCLSVKMEKQRKAND